jgi:hypothetical protein
MMKASSSYSSREDRILNSADKGNSRLLSTHDRVQLRAERLDKSSQLGLSLEDLTQLTNLLLFKPILFILILLSVRVFLVVPFFEKKKKIIVEILKLYCGVFFRNVEL